MRVRHINFVIAIALSLGLHLLLWPASMRVKVGGWNFGGTEPKRIGQVTIILNPDSPPTKVPSAPKIKPPKPPEVHTDDEMGDAKGKGTGAQAAKGEQPLRAPEAEQDQALLSRDPVGAGRIGDPPAEYTGPRGEDGSGGQVGGAQTLTNPAHGSPGDLAKPDSSLAQVTGNSGQEMTSRTPRQSVVHGPEPLIPSTTPPNVAPPPSDKEARGAAPADITKTAQDAVRQQSPLVQVASAGENPLIVAPELGMPAEPKSAVSSAPPIPGENVDKAAIVKSPELPLAPAAVASPPPPAVDVALPKTANPAEHSQPAAVASADPTLVKTGDGRAPGRDRRSADPAQESDSESDAFSKTAIADVMRDGRLEVRKGRKVKTTRPHFLPGAEVAFLSNPDAKLVIRVAIDEKGNARPLDIIHSAGSVEIDEPCRVALYDWWFQPSHDKAGHPVPDVIEFTFLFR